MTAAAVAPTDRLAVMFTSGTTSEPKGVVLTQHNYAHVADTMSAIVGLRPEHRWLVTLPLFHANAQYYCIAPAIAVGASVALTSALSASQWLRQARDLSATHASLFAAPIRMILARRPADAPAVRLEHVWFAQNLGAQHYDEFAELAGCRPRQLYGMTETVAIVCADVSSPYRHDTIGPPVEGRPVVLVNPETGADPPSGEPGELVLGGVPGADIFLEYLDDPAATGRSLVQRDGATWFRTGDMVARVGGDSADRNGALRFVGRRDDVIKVSGENVSLTEVEATLAQAPGVLECAVLGRPDPVRDTVPVAYVVPRDAEHPPAIGDLAEWSERNLAAAARPRDWHLIEALPRTSVGKVRRFKL
jgi:crotonobetaine/carnitine-CoA ligase